VSYQAHKIIEHLFQGGRPPPGDGLKQAGVDVLVLCAKEHQDAEAYPGLIVIQAPGDDDARIHRMMRFIDTWKAAAKLVVDHVRAGRNVLVTCMAGQNRSGIVTAMAMCELTGKSGKECVDHVSRSRPFALNNATFAQYVIDNFPEEKASDPLP
jgi:protein-tyrosine phosphatase